MNLFVDTSALVKYYYPEVDSLEVERVILEAERLYLCELSLVEFASALMKKIQMNELQDHEQQLIWEAFLNDIQAESIELVELSQDDFRTASNLILRHGKDRNLRTLDSLQLAAALKLVDSRFLSSDKELLSVAKDIGLSPVTLN
ncbi:MAG: type II toxin-antitoxin system VapC family toxin [Actinomycetota bacterium]|nr:type II toxin-antitoxin system VapC family toxin [Actinomycetota bacterium]